VDGYLDEAVGILERNSRGQVAITHVTLRPAVAFNGRSPDAVAYEGLHREAHEQCFIANSVTSRIEIEPRIA
jgi:organic hydroperoxide reductase OsmC/OhrA